MSTMNYKGYEAKIGYESGDDVFYGRVLGIRDSITFQGTCIEDLKAAFAEAIDDYLDFCKEEGIEPEKSYSGQFLIRTTSDLHARISICAEREETSLNQWVIKTLQHHIE